MKKNLKAAIAVSFVLTLSVYFYELISINAFKKDLKKGNFGVPKNSNTQKLGEKMENYRENLYEASNERIRIVIKKIITEIIYICVCGAILIDTIRIFLFNVCKKSRNLYFKTLGNIHKDQVALTSLFGFLFTILYFDEYIEKYSNLGEHSILYKIAVYFVLFIAICPISIACIFFLLQNFGAQLILALYISLILYNFYDIFKVDKISPTLMKVSPDEFDETVQELLKATNLQDKVYKDVTSEETNAALVGFESSARIEIYGKFDSLPSSQRNSILLHEIGHAKDHSLLKKLIVYFGLFYLEMIIILYLHNTASHEFKCNNVARDSSFILLSIVYFLALRDWLLMFYKLSSQRAEIAADLITKNSGFAGELAKSLLSISVTEISYIKPTWLYNALYAMHPSIYDRVEYLLK